MMKNAVIVVLIVALTILSLLLYSRLYAWEGDDGGVDQWEVTLGRYADRVNNQMQLTEPPAPPTTAPPRPPHYDSWLRIQQCESGHLGWSANTGNGYYGGLQFDLTTWRATGRTGYPHQHSMLEQMWAAERVLVLRAGWGMNPWGAWPVCGGRR